MQSEELRAENGDMERETLPSAAMSIITATVQTVLSPIMRNIGEILERNSQAMERIAATQQMMSQRIADLEKQVRLKTPLSKAQEKYINDSIRARARELLDGKGLSDDKKAVTKLGGFIRKSVLARYGVNSLREAPAYDYETALEQVRGWNDLLAIRDVAKEARQRAEEQDPHIPRLVDQGHYCPKCGEEFYTPEDKTSITYCHDCGQAVKWDG